MGNTPAAATPRESLLAALESASPADAVAWLREAMASAADASQGPGESLSSVFASAMRRLGRDPLGAVGPLATQCGPLFLDLWRRGDAARACLLIAATERAAPRWEDLVVGLYRHGDEEERGAVLRSLCLLPEPCTMLEIALDAGRTNSMDLYAALALDNPYPAACYDDHTYDHVVLKCLFNGLPVERIVGLRHRANPQLTQMCEDYIAERMAACRTVPTDIWLALEPHAGAPGIALMLSRLHDPDPAHRRYAALALSRRRAEPDIRAALLARLIDETHPAVRAALNTPED